MKLKCVSSSSNGNFYTLTSNSGKIILLECGIKFEKICEHIDSWRNVVACFITHKDNDHSIAMNDLKKRFVKCYLPENLEQLKWFEISCFKVLPILTPHRTDIDCYSYLIECDNKIIFFATDTYQISITTEKQIDCAMIETNYIQSIIDERIDNCEDIRENYKSHLGLHKAKEWLDNLKLKPKKVIAVHLSKNNCNKNIVLGELKEYNVLIADKNLEVEI